MVLGFISGSIAFIFAIVGLVAFLGKGSLAHGIRGALSIIPVSTKITAIALIVLGLMGGAIGYGQDIVGSLGTASLSGVAVANTGSSPALVDCRFNTPSDSAGTNITERADTNSLKVYYLDIRESVGGAEVINGTISCDRAGDISKGAQTTCQIVGSTFKNEMSTTDSNTYSILTQTASASRIAGQQWASTAYLRDNAVALTSSDQEKTILTYAQDESNQALGYHFALPSTTTWGYLKNQTSQYVTISCDGVEQAKFVITKVSGTAS